MHVFSLSAEQVESCWDDFSHLLTLFEKMCRGITAQTIKEAAIASRQQIFGLQDGERIRGIVVTEIQTSVRGKICVLVAACGSAPQADKREILSVISDWARELGCVALRIQGRKGWLRWDPSFRQTGIVAERAL